MTSKYKYDAFICHASEDKEELVKPLAKSLIVRGLNIWYDEFSLAVGDSLISEINKGLQESRFGIIVLSENFFKKGWTEHEFKALLSRQINEKNKVLLPIWHKVSRDIVYNNYPMLSDIFSLNSNIGIDKLKERILVEYYKHPEIAQSGDKALTGIPFLDYLTSGGLKKNSSILIAGGKSIGKTTLALQIQKASLERNESCLFISYKELPSDIISLYNKLEINIEEYINKNKLRILDNYTCTLGINRSESLNGIPKNLRTGIITTKDPSNIMEYYKTQTKIMNKIGFGGVNIIDSINQRKNMIAKSIDKYGKDEYDKYFERFRARLSRIEGQIGLHLLDIEDKDLFNSQKKIQDGTIFLGKGKINYLQLLNFKDIAFDGDRHQFTINSKGLQFINI